MTFQKCERGSNFTSDEEEVRTYKFISKSMKLTYVIKTRRTTKQFEAFAPNGMHPKVFWGEFCTTMLGSAVIGQDDVATTVLNFYA